MGSVFDEMHCCRQYSDRDRGSSCDVVIGRGFQAGDAFGDDVFLLFEDEVDDGVGAVVRRRLVAAWAGCT
ncbi:hypothetical protein [Saccharothrix lopnurensis]|uniref:Uncharacterized protein n=1 Tax=Saccharothrix lopnurensis TaxID=1670621 RepID=A0ABW1PAM0_9PSEU